jgi:dihydropteroate synthase
MEKIVLSWKDYRLELGARTIIMGIVNVTPDSFSDGGRFHSTDDAVAQAERLAAAGADIIDIGGESTRPFARSVDQQEELDRVLPVLEKLAGRIRLPISIDTVKAEVAEAALNAGASIINDISALRMDPNMARVAAEHDVPVILMHMQGEPRTMQINPVYEDVVADVHHFLKQAIDRAVTAGIDHRKLIVDPGIGFGKTATHNLLLIQQIGAFSDLGVPILVGPSRKAFIRKILSADHGVEPAADSPPVETGTQAAVAAAVMNGAHIVRVHDVANTRAMVQVLDAIRNAKPDSKKA